MEIHFFSEGLNFQLVDEAAIKKWLLSVIKQEKNTCNCINLIFCSDEYLLEINKDYLQHDYYTDIITFQYETNPVEGDLYISLDRVSDNAKTENVPLDLELSRVMVHGVLHLLGYKDKSDLDKALMTKKENFYLELLPNVPRGTFDQNKLV